MDCAVAAATSLYCSVCRAAPRRLRVGGRQYSSKSVRCTARLANGDLARQAPMQYQKKSRRRRKRAVNSIFFCYIKNIFATTQRVCWASHQNSLEKSLPTNTQSKPVKYIYTNILTYYILCSSQLGRNMTKFEPKDRSWVLCTIGRNILWRSCLILSTCGIFTRFLCIIHITNIQVTKFKLYNFLNPQIRLWQ